MKRINERKRLLIWVLVSIAALAIVVDILLEFVSISWQYNDIAGSVWRRQDAEPRIEVVSAVSNMDSVYCFVRLSGTTKKTTNENVLVVLYGNPNGSKCVMKKSLYTMELSSDTLLFYYVAPRWDNGHPTSLGVFCVRSQEDTVPMYKSRLSPELVVRARPLLH